MKFFVLSLSSFLFMCPDEIIRTPTMLRVVSGARFLSNWNSKVVKKNSDHSDHLSIFSGVDIIPGAIYRIRSFFKRLKDAFKDNPVIKVRKMVGLLPN